MKVTPVFWGATPNPYDADFSALNLALDGLDDPAHRVAEVTVVVRALLDHGADPNIPRHSVAPVGIVPNGTSAFSMAVWCGSAEMVNVFFAHGVHFDPHSNEARDLLFEAALNRDPGVMTVLLNHGMSIHTTDRNGGHLLTDAAVNGNMKVMRLLLDRGATINMQEEALSSAVEYATDMRKLVDVKYLDPVIAFL